MKKFCFVILLLTLILTVGGCSDKTDTPNLLDKEGIAPYELTEREHYLLQSFGMDSNSQIISFNAPKDAISLNVNVYRLEDDEKWGIIGGGGISIGADREPTDRLVGTFTTQLKENFVIDFIINSTGLASFKSNQISLDSEAIASAKIFLKEFQDIELNTEIPVALMVYDSGTTLRGYSLQDYFEPSKFEGMDLVQVVTLEFSSYEL